MHKIMNGENDWYPTVNGDVLESPVDCDDREGFVKKTRRWKK